MESQIEFAGLMPHAPVLIPSVGGRTFPRVQATAEAMDTVARHALAAHPETVVIISPHSPRKLGSFGLWYTLRLRGSLEQFGAPDETVDLPLDRAFTERIEVEAGLRGLSTWRITRRELDHGALVPLHFLALRGWDGPTVIIGLDMPQEGGLDEIGQAIGAAARGLKRRTAVIASGDMSHKLTPEAPAGYDPDGHRFDDAFVGLLRKGAFGEISRIDPALQERAAEDVVDSTRVALAASESRPEGHHEVLSYEGPFGVGYCVAILYEREGNGAPEGAPEGPAGKRISRLEDLPEVARCAVETRLGKGPDAPPFFAEGEAAARAGVFVTLETVAGRLRGCVGVMVPNGPDLVRETWRMAVSAALSDSRFPPVEAEELPGLRFSVTVLGAVEPVASVAQLDPAVYGVVVSAGDGRTGVLLPALQGIDSVDRQLSIAREKAGIAPDEPVRIKRFTARSFKERPDGPHGGHAGAD